MTKKGSYHLNQDDLVTAVVDEEDLAEEVRGHLAACSACRKRKEILEGTLTSLGHTARAYVPALTKTVRIPVGAGRRARSFLFPLRPAVATALGGLAVAVFGWWLLGTGPFPGTGPDHGTPGIWEDALTEEVAWPAEDPLPAVYRDMADILTEERSSGFMDFVAPLPEEGQGISEQGGGIRSC